MPDPNQPRPNRPVNPRSRAYKAAQAANPTVARHAAWLIPSLAGIGFLILIGGSLAVRQVVVLMRRPAAVEDKRTEEGRQESAQPDMEDAAVEPDAVRASLIPSADAPIVADTRPTEPLEVLPPAAAREPGRALAKMLLVGAGRGMFASLDDALSVAIRGDVIELRGEGPYWLRKTDLTFEPDPAARPITIRAALGFEAVIRLAYPSTRDAIAHVRNADLMLERIHFASAATAARRGYPFIFRVDAGNLTARACSLTKVAGATGGYPTFALLAGADSSASFSGCLFRATQAASLAASNTRLTCEGCAWLYCRGSTVSIEQRNAQLLEIVRCTFYAASFAQFSASEADENQSAPRIDFRQNLFVSPWCCPHFISFQVPAAHRNNLTQAAGLSLANQWLGELNASDNLVQFWEQQRALIFPTVDSAQWQNPVSSMFSPLGPRTKSLRYGPRLEAIAAAMFRGEFQNNVRQLGNLASTLNPEDLLISSQDPATQKLLLSGRYGAKPGTLAHPPPLASEPYAVPAVK